MAKYRQQATSDIWGIICVDWYCDDNDDVNELTITMENHLRDVKIKFDDKRLTWFSPAGLRELLYSVQINAGDNLEVFELYTR